jgi:hypothetical protein
VRSFGIELVHEGVEAGLLLKAVHARRAGCLLFEREVRALMAPFCRGWPGLMRSMAMPSRSHQRESFDRLNKALGLAKGAPLSERMACGRPRSLEGGDGEVFACRIKGFAQKREARGMVGDGQRIAVSAVAELELALEIGAPQVIGSGAR